MMGSPDFGFCHPNPEATQTSVGSTRSPFRRIARVVTLCVS